MNNVRTTWKAKFKYEWHKLGKFKLVKIGKLPLRQAEFEFAGIATASSLAHNVS